MPLSDRAKEIAHDTYNKRFHELIEERSEKLSALHLDAGRRNLGGPMVDGKLLQCHLEFLRQSAFARLAAEVEAYENDAKIPDSTEFEALMNEISGWLNVQGQHLARQFTQSSSHLSSAIDGIVSRVRQEFRLYVNKTSLQKERERSYRFLGMHDALETALLRIVEVLKNRDPALPEQIETAANRLRESSAESLSQAALTCRRMLKTYADSVYPSVAGSSGRNLDDSHFINRIWQFIEDRVADKGARELSQNTLESLGRRVDAIYEISNKGVHSDFSTTDASLCLVQTVFLLADISELAGHSRSREITPRWGQGQGSR